MGTWGSSGEVLLFDFPNQMRQIWLGEADTRGRKAVVFDIGQDMLMMRNGWIACLEAIDKFFVDATIWYWHGYAPAVAGWTVR